MVYLCSLHLTYLDHTLFGDFMEKINKIIIQIQEKIFKSDLRKLGYTKEGAERILIKLGFYSKKGGENDGT